jgi:hypothetical protein
MVAPQRRFQIFLKSSAGQIEVFSLKGNSSLTKLQPATQAAEFYSQDVPPITDIFSGQAQPGEEDTPGQAQTSATTLL